MIENTIKDYFLDKPGTFEDREKSYVTLNLASEKVCEIHQDFLDIKMDEAQIQVITSKFDSVKIVKTEGHFSWSQIPTNEIPYDELCDLIDQSYESVMHTLPEDEQKEILDLEW